MMINKRTLFIWDGILEATDNLDCTWYGVVVATVSADASQVEAPARNAFKEFVDSDKLFKVTGPAEPIDGSKDGNKFKPHRMNLVGGEGWDCNGNNTRVKDTKHEILLERLYWQGSPDKRNSLVYAQGFDGNGVFISVGWMRPGNRITLARRYLENYDSRAKWTVEMLREEILKQIYDPQEDEITMPPWHCSIMNA